MAETKSCNIHPEHIVSEDSKDGFCPHCVEELKNAPDPDTMTVDEKVAEWDRWCGPLWVPFGDLHQRAEQLLGSPIWTHEFARPEWIRERIAKGEGRDQSPLETLAEVAGDKPIIAVELPS